MKTLGIVGGIGPESTIEYYRFILDGYRARVTAGSAPHLIIDSLDVNRGIALLDANDLAGLTDYISASIERLTRAGAEVALMAANTPHIIFDRIKQRASIPMISIVQATCDRARALGFKRLGLLGTGFTMRARFYPDVAARGELELVTPAGEEQAFIHEKDIHELLKNQFLPETARSFDRHCGADAKGRRGRSIHPRRNRVAPSSAGYRTGRDAVSRYDQDSRQRRS